MGAAEVELPPESRFFFLFFESEVITGFELPKATKYCIKSSKKTNTFQEASDNETQTYDSGKTALQ